MKKEYSLAYRHWLRRLLLPAANLISSHVGALTAVRRTPERAVVDVEDELGVLEMRKCSL